VAVRVTFATVRRIGLKLPGAEPGTCYGAPALKVHGRMFACMASHKSAEPGSLAILIPFDRRDELIEAEPAIYYVKEHYVPYPCVLVRLARVHADALPDLLRMAWQFVSAKAAKKRAPKPRGPATARRR
jgi:hypothetical protein